MISIQFFCPFIKLARVCVCCAELVELRAKKDRICIQHGTIWGISCLSIVPYCAIVNARKTK